MDVEILAGRRLWVGIPGPELDDATRTHLTAIKPGGIVLFRRNITGLDQTRDLITALRALLGQDLRIAADQEGGLVVRFLKELTVFPGNMALGAAAFREPSMGEALAEEQGLRTAQELGWLGVDVNLAPVLDLATRGDNPGIGIRSFGHWPELGEKLGASLLAGFDRGGLIGCLKHFPGKGEAQLDAHLDLPRVPAMDQATALRPFAAAIERGANLIMTSHVIFEGLDPQRPVTFSPLVVNDLLRKQMSFQGVVMTDDLEMGAMAKHYSWEETVRGAAEAGHDVFCICHDRDLQTKAFEQLAEAHRKGDERYGDPSAIEAHLNRLPGRQPQTKPDLERGAALSEAIAGRAVTVIEEGPTRLPIAEDASVALILPTIEGLTQVENPLRGEATGHELAAALGAGVKLLDLPTEPSEKEIIEALAAASDCEVLLVVTTAARFLDAQRRLVRAALVAHPRVILLPIRNPFDLEVVPSDISMHAVVTYGFRPVQFTALAKILRGETQAYGRLPVQLHREPEP